MRGRTSSLVSFSGQHIARAEAAASPPGRRSREQSQIERAEVTGEPELSVYAAGLRLLLFICYQQEV